MEQKHGHPEKISDDRILKEFKNAKSIFFSARRYNILSRRMIGFGDIGELLPLVNVLPILGITPEMLRPVVDRWYIYKKRRFPFNRRWFGLNKNIDTLERVEPVELPEKIETYDDLRSFPLCEKNFVELAKILGKPIDVARRDHHRGIVTHRFLFTAHPSGEVVEL